jgi:hypothetical protein
VSSVDDEQDARKNPRVGDRWVDEDDARITLTRVEEDDKIVHYSLLNVRGAVWTTRESIPLPVRWTLAGRAPEAVPMCVNHADVEAELGTVYCPECVDNLLEVQTHG